MAGRRGTGEYPDDWAEIAQRVKEEAGWRCVRCGHPAETPGERIPCDDLCDPARHPGGLNDGKQRVLTTHHLDGNKSNCAFWNIPPLCQVCHLHIQHKVVMGRIWYLPHSAWFKPYVAGYAAATMLGLDLDRETATRHADALIALHQSRIGPLECMAALEET